MIYITDLQPGDIIEGWMKLGFALQKKRSVHGHLYRQVPSKPDRFDKDDLQQFTGVVVSNNTTQHILSVETQRMNRFYQAVGETSLRADIHYLALLRVRKVSQTNYAPRPENPLRPTRAGLGTGFYPYRTSENVELRW